MARQALGRGLSALISAPPVPTAPQQTAHNQDGGVVKDAGGESPVSYLDVSRIVANPNQPRQSFTPQDISELSDSIRAHGVLQPILVRPTANGDRYEIVAGERRFRAAVKAHLLQVPVIIKVLSERETLEVAIVENVQRQNLTPIEEARSYHRLMEEFSQTAQEIAEKVGKDRVSVSNIVRILKLPDVVQRMIEEGRLTLGHAKAILTVREPAAQIGLAKKVEEERLSVRALEAIVSREVCLDPPKRGEDEDRGPKRKKSVEGPYFELEERLRRAVGTKVAIRARGKASGTVHLHFFSEDELTRLVEIVERGADPSGG